MSKPLLSINNLNFFFKREGLSVIRNISYDLHENEILGIVGESGSGKSVSSMAIMGLLPAHISKISEGSIVFKGIMFAKLNEKNL
jgi:peptide/nickel transport system ATP-binding protein